VRKALTLLRWWSSSVSSLGVCSRVPSRAEMRFALTSFALAQESYFHDHRVYGNDLAMFRDRGFSPTPRATIVVNEATAVGWSATARHAETRARCFLYVRDAAPLGPATREGVVSCG
jgi:hypothetical protein